MNKVPFVPVGDQAIKRYRQGEELTFRIRMGEGYDTRFDKLGFNSTIRLRPVASVAVGGDAPCAVVEDEDVPVRVVYVGSEGGNRIIKVRRDPLQAPNPNEERSTSALPLGC